MIELSWEAVGALFLIVTAVAGWIVASNRRSSGRILELEKNLAEYKVEVSEKYAHYKSLQRVEENFTDVGDRLVERMDHLSNAMQHLTGRLAGAGVLKP